MMPKKMRKVPHRRLSRTEVWTVSLTAFFVSGAHIVGNQDIGADGEADKYVYQQVDEGTCASYGGQSLMAGKPAHNNNIGRVE